MPLDDLGRICSRIAGIPWHTENCSGCHNTAARFRPKPPCLSAGAVGRMIGVPPSTAEHWARNGVPWAKADAAANALGMHPCEIWGESWWIDDKAAA